MIPSRSVSSNHLFLPNKRAALSFGLATLVAISAQAATISSDWNQYTTGTYQWGNAANWTSQTWMGSPVSDWGTPVTPGSVPNNDTDIYAARIIHAGTENVAIETNTDITLGRLWLERAGSGTLTLKLGGDMLINGVLPSGSSTRPTAFRNTTASTPDALVLDLSGNTFQSTAAAPELQNARNYTIRDTSASGNGVFSVKVIGRSSSYIEGRVNVENRVTVQVTDLLDVDLRSSTTSTIEGWNFAHEATLELLGGTTGGVTRALWVGGVFGNVIVGNENNDIATVYSPSGNDMRILGNVEYKIAKNHQGALLTMGPTGRKIYVGGNFTDKAAEGADYGGTSAGGIIFNGGAELERQIWIARAGLSTVFQIGESNSIAGNIALAHDLTTKEASPLTGRVILREGSRLNLNTFTLHASRVDVFSSTAGEGTVAYTFGHNNDPLLNPLIKADGILNLSRFNLELTYDGSGWTNGDDLLLFEYGSLSGTPLLGDVFAPNISHGGLFNDQAGHIWLTDIVVHAVPEPSTVVYIACGIIFLTIRQRKSRNTNSAN